MEWWIFLIIGVGVGLLVVTRYFKSFFHDYAYDAALSFLDEAFGGFLGLDIGDWIAAILMYRGEKKRVGAFAAFIIAWEATNFLPISLIPFIGTGLEYVTNLVPAATVMNVFFNKKSAAESYQDDLDDLRDLAKEVDVDVDAEDAEDAFEEENWVEAAKRYKDVVDRTEDEVEGGVRSKRRNVRRQSHRLVDGVHDKNTERARRIRRGTAKIEDLTTQVKDDLQRDKLEDAVIHVRAAEEILGDLRNQ